MNDHVGVVDRPAAVPLAAQNRCGDGLGGGYALPFEHDIRKAADEADVVDVLLTVLVVGLDDEFGAQAQCLTNGVGYPLIDPKHVGSEESSETEIGHVGKPIAPEGAKGPRPRRDLESHDMGACPVALLLRSVGG